MRRATLTILLFSFWLTCLSQEKGSVSGYVTDGTTTRKLPDVIVSVDKAGKRVITDQDGFYAVTGLENGEYTLIFSHISYHEKEQRILITNGQNEVISVVLVPSIEPLDEFVVEGSWFETGAINTLPYIQTELRKEQIDETAARDIGDLLRSSNNISGIRKGGGNIDPVVRGFKFSQLNVHLNKGVKIEGGCPNRMDPATSHVEIEDVVSIDVIKGPYSLRYGPALGAVIHVKTMQSEPGPEPFLNVTAMKGYESNWNGNREHISFAAGNRLGFFQVSGGQKAYGNYKDGNGERISSSFYKRNFRGLMGIRPAKNHLLRISIEDLRGRDVMFPALAMDERNDDTRLYSAGYSITSMPGRLDFVSFHLHRSEVIHEMDNKQRPISDTVVAITIVEALNQGARIETGLTIGQGKMITGFDLERIAKDGDRIKRMIRQAELPSLVEMIWNNARITNMGFFAEYSAAHGNFDWIISARFDRNEAGSDEVVTQKPGQGEIYRYATDSIRSEHNNLSISMGGTRMLSENWSVSFALGRATRSPDMTERYIVLLPVGYDRFDYLGDPRLKPETNNQIDITLKFNDNRFGNFQINGFFSLVNNYITGKRLSPTEQNALTAGVLGVKKYHNAGTAMLRGFEFSYTSPAEKAFGSSLLAAATYGTLNEAFQFIFDESGMAIDDRLLKHDPLTEIPPLEATMAFHYKTVKGKLIPQIKLRGVAAQHFVSKASYEEPTPGFLLVSTSVNFRFSEQLSLVCGANNLLDKAYYEHLNRAIIGSKENLAEPGRSFFVNLIFKIYKAK